MSEREALKPSSEVERGKLDVALQAMEGHVGVASTFLSGRGLKDEAVQRFRLGVVPAQLAGFEHYAGMLAIPYLLLDSRPIQIRFRRLGGDGPKYMTMAGDQSRMFNVGAAVSPSSEIHVTEGEIDCMTLVQCGLNAVAIPGVNNFKPHHVAILAGFESIYIWGDPDEAGREFNAKVRNMVPRSRVVPLVGGDINDTFLKGGYDEIYRLKSEA